MANVLNQRFSPLAQKIDLLRQGVEVSEVMQEPMLTWSDLPEVSRKKSSKNQRLFFKETENVRSLWTMRSDASVLSKT